ncbi:hypothetical protein C8R43DRAFT_825575, partial [Mycena crocata]
RYEGWVESAISLLRRFVDDSVNPRNHYLDLEEIAECAEGSILHVARLSAVKRDLLRLPTRRQTFVAIKSIPIMPTGTPKLLELHYELSLMGDIHNSNILGFDTLYLDPVEDTIWIRMELMARSLSSVIDLNGVGLILSDRVIAGCTKDILSGLEHLRLHGIAPRNICSDNVLINLD